MRILVINWQDRRNPFAGGAEVHIHEIFGRIARMGHKVTLLCCSFEGGAPFEILDGIEVIRARGLRNTFNFTAFLAYKTGIGNEKFDIVVEDINKIPFYTPLYVNSPVLAVVPHLFGKTIFQEIPLPLSLYIYLWELPIPSVYRKVPFTVISQSTKEDLVRRGIRPEDIEVVHCGLNRETYHPGGEKAEYPAVCYLGRLKRYKRVDFLLQAMRVVFSKIPEARLTVLGDGDALGELVRLSGELGIKDKVSFRGWVNKDEKARTLQRAHLLVNTSPKEGWGLTGIEAMGCGTPVVASNSPGLRDSVVDGVTGFLVEHGDVERLAERIIEILKNGDLRERLSENAAGWARRFSWDTAAERTLSLLEKVITRRERR